jgi:hypothetical protein
VVAVPGRAHGVIRKHRRAETSEVRKRALGVQEAAGSNRDFELEPVLRILRTETGPLRYRLQPL